MRGDNDDNMGLSIVGPVNAFHLKLKAPYTFKTKIKETYLESDTCRHQINRLYDLDAEVA